jgi:hypothetical protein
MHELKLGEHGDGRDEWRMADGAAADAGGAAAAGGDRRLDREGPRAGAAPRAIVERVAAGEEAGPADRDVR